MKARQLVGVTAIVSAVCGIVLLLGCEQGNPSGLVVSPSSYTLNSTSNTVTFTVVLDTNDTSALVLPLDWSVSDPSLGNIIVSSGYSATYSRSANNGNNIVTVKDQYDREGSAVVTQVWP